MIVLQDAAESFTTFDRTGDRTDVVAGLDKLAIEPLMISFSVMMLDVLADSSLQRLMPEEDHVFETF